MGGTGFGDMFGTTLGFATGESGGFMNLLGPEGMGLTGSSSESEQRIELDPTTRALNQFRLQQLQNAGFNSGELFGRPDYAFNMSPEAGGISQLIQAAGTQPGVDPWSFYNNSLGMQNQGFQQTQDYLSGLAGQNRNMLENTLQNQLGYGAGINESVLNQQLGYINNNLRPEMTSAGNQYYQNILGPQIGSENALMGLARSGARQEAEAKGAASIALPIEQTLAGMSGNALSQYGQNYSNLVNSAYGQYGSGLQNALGQNYGAQAGLGQQNLQNLFGLNTWYPGMANQTLQSNMSRLGNAFTAADYARALQQQGFQGQQNAFLSAFNATPYTPASTVYQSGTGNQGLISSVMGGAGAGSAIGGVSTLLGSDRRLKKNIQKFDSKEFLKKLKAYSYEYKDVSYGVGRHAGIMAQELQETELGKDFVFDSPDGKYILCTPNYINLLTACIVDLGKRVEELENASR